MCLDAFSIIEDLIKPVSSGHPRHPARNTGTTSRTSNAAVSPSTRSTCSPASSASRALSRIRSCYVSTFSRRSSTAASTRRSRSKSWMPPSGKDVVRIALCRPARTISSRSSLALGTSRQSPSRRRHCMRRRLDWSVCRLPVRRLWRQYNIIDRIRSANRINTFVTKKAARPRRT